jgi:hypothetical protein
MIATINPEINVSAPTSTMALAKVTPKPVHAQ